MEAQNINRERRQRVNSIVALLNQVVVIGCGLILPRLIIGFYGSKVNGLISSIMQFLGLITIMDLGLGAVVQSSLYKPLAYGNMNEVSQIMKSARRFFRKIALGFILYTIALGFVYPHISSNPFDTFFTVSLIVIMSISMFTEYFLGITYMILINADHKTYIYLNLYSVTLLLNIIVAVICIKVGASIQVLKAFTSLIFIIRPFFLKYYTFRNYKLHYHIQVIGEPIKQKWNGIAQHLAYIVSINTDVIVLTMFSTLENVSIYMVYRLVVTGLSQIIKSLTTGMPAFFGNLYAKGQRDYLLEVFGRFEWLIHTLLTFSFSVCGVLIIPFVRVYTFGIEDANYIVPLFAMLIVWAQMMFVLRHPYNMIIKAAGHYRETQLSSMIEMMLNIILSVSMVIRFGLVGVAIGTVVAMSYRVIYLVIYLSNSIINREIKHFIYHFIVDCIGCAFIIASGWFVRLQEVNFLAFLSLAVLVSLYGIMIQCIVNYIFYKDYMLYYIRKIMQVLTPIMKKI